MNANEIPDAIKWHEGMMLSPQHFQQQSARFESLLQYHAATISPFYWGIRKLKYDLINAAPVSSLSITELEAVMPDGLVVAYDKHLDGALTLELNPHDEEMRLQALPVHLAVEAKRQESGKGTSSRYRSFKGELIVNEDDHTGDAVRIPRLRPHLRLLATLAPPPKYVSFPLTKVSLRGEVFETNDFIPPWLTVSPNSPLGEMCNEIARNLRNKATDLFGRTRRSSGSTEISLLQEGRTLLQSLVMSLPCLEASLHSAASHPYTLYLALCQLAGNVAVIGKRVPPFFSPYKHDDLRATFEPVGVFIKDLLAEAISVSYQSYRFRLEDGFYNLDLQPDWKKQRMIIGLRGQYKMTGTELVAWGKECLIGSKSKMQTLLKNRVLGASREQVDEVDDLFATEDVVLFSLDGGSEHLEQDLQIFNPDDRDGRPRPSEILLFVLDKSGGKKGQTRF